MDGNVSLDQGHGSRRLFGGSGRIVAESLLARGYEMHAAQFRFAPAKEEPTTLPQVLNDPTVYQISPDQVPIKRLRSGVRAGQWNELELLLDENVMRGY